MAEKRVQFGCREVGPEEKAALVSDAFDAIARTYDRANSLFSLGIDGRWRRKGIRMLGLRPGDSVLDACGGTGALAWLAARRVGPGGLAVVLDRNLAMLEAGLRRSRRALRSKALISAPVPVDPGGVAGPGSPEVQIFAPSRERTRDAVPAPRRGRPRATDPISWVRGDVERLGFPDESFDAVTMGFGLRNIVHLGEAFREIARVLKPEGRFMAIDFGRPPSLVVRKLYDFYSFKVMPAAAWLLFGDGKPYRYLAESVRVFQRPETTVAMLEESGLANARFRPLTAGIAVIFLAEKIISR